MTRFRASTRLAPGHERWRAARLAPALAAPLVVLLLGASPSGADLPLEQIGDVASLPPPGPHLVWVSDAVAERTALVDLDADRLLGVLDGGWGITVPLFSRDGREVYVPETHYSRRSRGERTDVVTFYDAATLLPSAEVVIPPARAINALPSGNASVSDDGRFLAVFNMNPATSLSIVDLRERRFSGRIETPGCSLAYAAGPRRFALLCADGALMLVALDEQGRLEKRTRSPGFFDPEQDPVTEKAARIGSRWLFVSFEGFVHPVDLSGEVPVFGERWSLLDERDRADSWRVGGGQHLAVHEASGRLYSLVHQGGRDTHKHAGSELWVYDLASRERLQRIELKSPGLTYLGVPIIFGQDWIWPFNGLYDALLGLAGDTLGIDLVAVTQDAKPLLVTGSAFSGMLAVYDAESGEFVRRVTTGNMTALSLQPPGAATGAGR